MKKFDSMISGLVAGLMFPAVVFFAYFWMRDPQLHIFDQVKRLKESGVLSYYLSLAVISNLGLFFLFLRTNAEKAARGVLGATIIYAFTVLFLKLA